MIFHEVLIKLCFKSTLGVKKGTIIKKLYKVNIGGNNVWFYIAENNGKIRMEDAGVNIK